MLIGPELTIGLTATVTDDGFTEVKDAVGTLSLWQVAKGKTFHSFGGQYAAGGASFRIRNTVTNRVKAAEFLGKIGGRPIGVFDRPITIEENDVCEVMAEAVPT
jgi:hypothetical protein